MMRVPFLTAALLALALQSPAALASTMFDTYVKNETGNCAWITIYDANDLGRWGIKHARFVKPGATEHFRTSRKPDLRVRAEVKGSAECGNTQNIADVHDWRKGMQYYHSPTFHARLVKTGDGKFHVWING